MHTIPRWIGDDYIRKSMSGDKLFIEDIFHISYKKIYIAYLVVLSIFLSISNGFRYCFYSYDFFSFFSDKLGNSTCPCIEIVYQFFSCEGGKVSDYFVEFVSLS